MNPDLKPGVSEEQTITTTPDMGISHLGPSAPPMYSTPSMIALIEAACVTLMTRYVDEGEQSVGFHIDVRHLAPTTIGQRVTAKVTVREVNKRRYRPAATPGKFRRFVGDRNPIYTESAPASTAAIRDGILPAGAFS